MEITSFQNSRNLSSLSIYLRRQRLSKKQTTAQPAFSCSKSTIETPEQFLKSVPS